MQTKKEYGQKVLSAMMDAYENTRFNQGLTLDQICRMNTITGCLRTILVRNRLVKGQDWIAEKPTIEQAIKIGIQVKEYHRETNRKITKRGNRSKVQNPISESDAIEVLKNSINYKYKITRSPKIMEEEIIL